MSTQTLVPEMEAPVQMPTQETKTHNIFDNALLLCITRTWIPQTKTIRTKVLQSTADPKMVSANKKLFDCPELRAIIRHEEKLDEYLKWKATPFPLKKSHRLIGADLFHEIEHRLMQHVNKRNELIEAFIAAYQGAKDHAKALLGDQYSEHDYPSVERVRQMFHFQWEYLEFTVSEKLQELNKEVAERKQQEWQTQIVQAGEAADQLLSAQFKLLIDGLNEKLAPTGEKNEDGSDKEKTLRSDALDKVQAFLADMPARNVNQNDQLKAFTSQASQLLNGVTPAKMKENQGLKDQVRDGFATLKASLDKLVVEQGTRAITFED